MHATQCLTEPEGGQLEKARGIADGFRDAWHRHPWAMEIDSGTTAGLQTGLELGKAIDVPQARGMESISSIAWPRGHLDFSPSPPGVG